MSLEEVVRVAPVSLFFNVIAAPTTTACVLSRIAPSKVALAVACPNRFALPSKSTHSNRNPRATLLFMAASRLTDWVGLH